MKNGIVRSLILCLFILSVIGSKAAIVDTVTTYSASMKKNIKAVVIRPNNYSKEKALPVIYLLHGHGGKYNDWITRVPGIAKYADQYGLIIVCPDGGISSWYFDSPVDSSSMYETYVSKELVKWIDEHYSTIRSNKGRGITGLSMGGHGALYLSFRNQDVYGTAGSMSGGVDLVPFPGNWEIWQRLGTYAQYPSRWESSSIVNMTHLLMPNSLALIIDCGTNDFFYKVNEKLHEQLLYSNIPHDYISRPGGHTWEYWDNAIGYQVMFMNKFFVSQQR